LQADGYSGFDPLYHRGDVAEAACWAHARRKFFLLYQLQASPIAKEALDRIGELYGIEREIAGLPAEARRQVREARAGPKLEAFHQWLLTTLNRVSQSSALASAIRYSLKRWRALMRIPAQAGPRFRLMPGRDSGACRATVPGDAGPI
jgi:transposase